MIPAQQLSAVIGRYLAQAVMVIYRNVKEWRAEGRSRAAAPPARAPRPASPASAVDRAEPARLLLASEDGVESWVDFRTGRVESELVKGDVSPAHTPLLEVARRALREEELLFQQMDDRSLLLAFRETRGRYHVLIQVREDTRAVRVSTAYGAMAPEEMRGAMAELADRITERASGVLFAVDEDYGSIYVNFLLPLGNTELTASNVTTMLKVVLGAAEQWHDPVMRFLFAGISADEAIHEGTGEPPAPPPPAAPPAPLYRWECPKCGRRYVDGTQPVTCEQPFFLKVPGRPKAAADGLLKTVCGAPMVELKPPRRGYGR